MEPGPETAPVAPSPMRVLVVQGPADLAFVDLRLGTASGLELVPRMLAESPNLDIVLITAYATFDTADVAEGRFREDLLYRLNVVEVTLPALRERRDDILPLARRFVAFFARAAKRPTPELSAETERMLLAYGWPGNVRELRNALERALIVWPANVLEPQAFPERITAAGGSAVTLGGPHTLEEIEREHILRVLASAPTLDEAARLLGIDASTLWRKRKKYESPPTS